MYIAIHDDSVAIYKFSNIRCYICDYLSENQPIVHTSDFTKLIDHKTLQECHIELKLSAVTK